MIIEEMKTRLPYFRFRCCSILVLAAVFLLTSGCKDPDEYDPTQPLEPPPGPPALIHPMPDTNLCGGVYQIVFFDWHAIPGAQMYELQIDTSVTFTTPDTVIFHMLLLIALPPAHVELYRYADPATYYAVIRAGSTSWSTYTEWSEPRRFFLRPDP